MHWYGYEALQGKSEAVSNIPSMSTATSGLPLARDGGSVPMVSKVANPSNESSTVVFCTTSPPAIDGCAGSVR